jgi:hypothetical protein
MLCGGDALRWCMAGAVDFAFGLYSGDCGCGRCWREEALKTWFRIRVGFVESCVQKSRKLLTQLPLHSTPLDSWELVKTVLENIPPSTTGDLCSSSQVCAHNLRSLGGGKCANPTTSANAANAAGTGTSLPTHQEVFEPILILIHHRCPRPSTCRRSESSLYSRYSK